MKKALHLFATLLCLLTIAVSAATCAELSLPKQSSCDHCPKQSPLDHHSPACCSAQQQQPSAIVSKPVETQAQLHVVAVFASSNKIFIPLDAPAPRWAAPPPLPPRTPLRI
ncbi:hypothetical protein [Tunturiibacter gelidoferens]|uniref:Uncharacterized protein n=1 Tax=Tunturiibacter gelidiferens TaxID=3069689 RepID=A0ACC5NXQ4_9BACT|nr:hypothetical protein [Edaphobacter lichenicola]MBB5339352.1 hypothetical protein [Edaphobacter lichenicola]